MNNAFINSLSISSNLTVSGNSLFNYITANSLFVSGNTYFNSNLIVSGNSLFNNVTILSNLNVSNNTILNNISITGTLNVSNFTTLLNNFTELKRIIHFSHIINNPEDILN